MLLLLLLINPYLFGVSQVGDISGRQLLLLVFLYTFFLPAISIMVMHFLGMISSLEMRDRHERIGPYIVTGVLYLWIYYNFLNNSQIPTAYSAFMLGAVIALFTAFFINIFSKISIHAVGMGGLVAMVIITTLLFSYGTFTVNLAGMGAFEVNVNTVLLLIILLAGLVGTARFILQAHDPLDLYGGYVVGFAAQVIAVRILF